MSYQKINEGEIGHHVQVTFMADTSQMEIGLQRAQRLIDSFNARNQYALEVESPQIQRLIEAIDRNTAALEKLANPQPIPPEQLERIRKLEALQHKLCFKNDMTAMGGK